MGELLQVENLKTYFKTSNGIIKAVDDVSFSVKQGEVLGLVGESGSGKSMTCRSIMRLISPPGQIIGGKILFQGQDILRWPMNQMVNFRGAQVSMILQEPMTALNPVQTVGMQIAETIIQHEKIAQKAAMERAIQLFRKVGIPAPERRIREYPHQFSGGMRQRVMIAIALACRPKVLLADEPTTALDVTIQDQIIRLVKDLQAEMGMSVVWVTHDLGVVAQLCDRVAVMYAGHIMELAGVIDIFENSRHPYTRGLLESIPSGETRDVQKLIPITGQPPDLCNLPAGCPFMPRCRYYDEGCSFTDLALCDVNNGHRTACRRFMEIWN